MKINREIKFRGKRADDNKWVDGFLFKQYEVFGIQVSNALAWEVIPETIGQYTGLKDKNGVEIYEGDILRNYGHGIEDWVVSYEYGKFVGTFDNVCEDLYEISDFEVIRNIYDELKDSDEN